MKKLFFAILIIGAIAGIVLYVESRKTSKSPVIATEDPVVNQVSSSSSSSSTVVTGTAITTTYQPDPIGGNVEEILNITMTGLLLANHYDVEIATDLSAFTEIEAHANKVGADTVRITIKNYGLTTVTLPLLTISALKLN